MQSQGKDIVKAAGLDDTQPKITTVARKSVNGEGPLFVDGAFTRLYHNFTGGSARFVKNVAAFLAVDFQEKTTKKELQAKTDKYFSDSFGAGMVATVAAKHC